MHHKIFAELQAAKRITSSLVQNPSASAITIILQETAPLQTNVSGEGAPSADIHDREHVPLKRFSNVIRMVCVLLVKRDTEGHGSLDYFLQEVFPALVQKKIYLSYWIELVMSCQNSEIVVKAVAEAAKNGSNRTWLVQTSLEMKAVSKMLQYHQPARLDIKPLHSQERNTELVSLMNVVAQIHKGQLSLLLRNCHATFSDSDSTGIISCLESAQCQLVSFMGCLSGSNARACRALTRSVRRSQEANEPPRLFISLLDPMPHQLGLLEGTEHVLDVRVRLPSVIGERSPLPTSSSRSPRLTVEFQHCEAGGPSCNEMTRLIQDLNPQDKWYDAVYFHQYPGTDDALLGVAEQLSANEVRTEYCCSPGWAPVGRNVDENCYECGQYIHQGGKRCVWLILS